MTMIWPVIKFITVQRLGLMTISLMWGYVTTYNLTGLTKGQTYFIVTTAYNTSNNESGYSNEVSGMAG